MERFRVILILFFLALAGTVLAGCFESPPSLTESDIATKTAAAAVAAVKLAANEPTKPPSKPSTTTRTATRTVTQTPTPTKTSTPTRTPTRTSTPTPPPNQPPIITKFVAQLAPPYTNYSVTAIDPDGDSSKLVYRWSTSNSCGAFGGPSGASSASWFHPHPPCFDERVHPANITVIVRDPQGGEAKYIYSGGSAGATIVLTPVP